MNTYKKTLCLISALILLPCFSFAGTGKSGGAQTIMLDSAGSSGGAATAGAMKLYSSIGQPSAPARATAGVYTLVGGFMSVVDETPPAISFTTPAAASAQSGSIGVAGTAFDMNGTQWTLYYGPGAAPAQWAEIASGTANVSSSAFAAWDSTGRSGPYTLKITATDGRGNTTSGTVTFNVGNAITITGTIPAFKWVMMCLPNEPSITDPVTLFGTGEYKIFRWDPAAENLSVQGRYRYPTTLRAGESYWIKSYYNDLTYTVQGSNADTTEDYVIPVKSGWNQIGSPFNRDYPMGQAQVRYNGNTYDLTTAANMGLVSTTMQEFNSNTNSWEQVNANYDMEPQEGCFFRAYSDVDLLLGPGAGRPGGLARKIRPVYDYNLKLSAAAGGSADTDNFLGALNLASDEYDAFDAEEPPKTPDEKFISLYFPRDNWQRNAGRYANDFRTPAASVGQTGDWTFNVDTNEIGQTVTLSWDNTALPADRFSFTLINLDTGERVNMANQNNYTFMAAGGDISTAHFRLEVVKLSVSQVTKSHTLAPGWNLISMPLEPEAASALAQLGDDLPMLDFFQYYDGKFYPAETADVQAGFGYWIYVAGNTEIDIQGLPPASTMRVPLKPGWNLIGNPFEVELAWGDNIVFVCGDAQYTLAQAVAAKMTSGKLFEYTGDKYNPASVLKPWTGYFINAAADCELELSRE